MRGVSSLSTAEVEPYIAREPSSGVTKQMISQIRWSNLQGAEGFCKFKTYKNDAGKTVVIGRICMLNTELVCRKMHINSSGIRILYPNNNEHTTSEQYVIQRFEFCSPISN